MAEALMSPGRYWGKITRQELGVSKEAKNPQFGLKFVVMGKINLIDPAGDLLPCPSVERTVFRSISEKAVEYLVEDLEYLCGKLGVELDLSGWEMLDPGTEGHLSFVGIETEFYCKHDTYKGKTGEKWSLSKGFDSEKPSDDQVGQLNRMFGKFLKKPAKAPGSRAVASTPAPAAEEPAAQDEPAEEGFTPTTPQASAAKPATRRAAANQAATRAQAPTGTAPSGDIPF